MKRKPKIQPTGDKTFDGIVFVGMAVLGIGAVIGAGMNLWSAGREYGMREMHKRLKDQDHGKE